MGSLKLNYYCLHIIYKTWNVKQHTPHHAGENTSGKRLLLQYANGDHDWQTIYWIWQHRVVVDVAIQSNQKVVWIVVTIQLCGPPHCFIEIDVNRYNTDQSFTDEHWQWRTYDNCMTEQQGNFWHCLKTGYIEFAKLESYVDATPAVMLSPAVAMAAEVHCQRQSTGAQWLANYLHDASRWLVITRRMCSHWAPAGGRWQWTSAVKATAGLNITAGVAAAEDSNKANYK